MTDFIHYPDDCFEKVCRNWENRMGEFINMLSDGDIPALKNAQWTFEKKRILVYPPDEKQKKIRGADGPHFRTTTNVNRSEANSIWKEFKKFSQEQGLNTIERLRNNEKPLGWYEFKSSNCDSHDSLSCKIYLPGEWHQPTVSFGVFIGPRYLNKDL